MTRYIALIATVTALLLAVPAAAQESPPKSLDIVFGQAYPLYSQTLGEQREIFVYTPTGYDRTDRAYPVLYVLDGNAHFRHATATAEFLSRTGQVPQVIVVAIPNVNRRRDFTPSVVEEIPGTGGAERFLDFIRDEVVAFVDSNFRTEPYRVLLGHSLGGMLAVHTIGTRSALFGGYIAASPFVEYDDNVTIKAMRRALGEKDLVKSLFITLGDEDAEAVTRLVDLLNESAPADLRWEYREYPDENHGSVALRSLYDGLLFVFGDWNLKRELAELGPAAIRGHFQDLSDRVGFDIQVDEGQLNRMGYTFLADEKFDMAIALFKLNIATYPQSANVYDSIGEGYEAMGEYQLAKMHYEIAVEKGEQIGDPNTRIYRAHLHAIEERLKSFN